MKLNNFFLIKSLLRIKARFFPKISLKTVLFMVLLRSRNRNRNLSKVGTGTVKNSYGSATLAKYRLSLLLDLCLSSLGTYSHTYCAYVCLYCRFT